MIIYLNGHYVHHKKAVVSVDDHGFLYGDGIYETIRIYEGRPFHFNDHLARLRTSAKGIGLRIPLSASGIKRVTQSLIRKNKLKEAVLRIAVTRGPGPRGLDPAPCKKPSLLMSVTRFKVYPLKWKRDGVRVLIPPIRRNSPLSIPPWVKSNNCLNGILAMQEAAKVKAQEAVMLSLENTLTEGTVSNVFLIKKDVMMTPRLDQRLLKGVTRSLILSLAKKLRLKTREARLTLTDLKRADEIFLTNTTMEIMPVKEVISTVGGRKKRLFSSKAPRVSRRLQEEFTRSAIPPKYGKISKSY